MMSNNVKRLLREKNLTLGKIARRLRISTAHVSYLLSGQRSSFRYETRIARVMGVKKSMLFPVKRT